MADKFSEYFSLVFTDENLYKVPLCNTTFPYPGEKLSDIQITEKIITKIFGKLRADKAPGADNILPRLLKSISSAVITPVTINFKKSMESGDIPDDWLLANVSPIYKNKGSRQLTENYRLVSLTSHCLKCLSL